MEFSRQEYWSGLPFPSPGGLPNLGIQPMSPALQADSLLSEPPGKSSFDYIMYITSLKDRGPFRGYMICVYMAENDRG